MTGTGALTTLDVVRDIVTTLDVVRDIAARCPNTLLFVGVGVLVFVPVPSVGVFCSGA